MLLAAFIIGMILFGVLDRHFRTDPHSITARTLGHRFGVKPSGPGGKYTRRERLRAAIASAFGACACLALAQLGAVIDQRFTDDTLANRVGEWLMLLGGLIGAVAVLATVLHALSAPFAPTRFDSSAQDA